MLEGMENKIAAFTQQRRPGGRDPRRPPQGDRRRSPGGGDRSKLGLPVPDPKFSGCWHCGKPDCSRSRCPEFKALLAENGGKLPKDYQGKYEKSLGVTAKVVGSLHSADLTTEHAETDVSNMIWQFLSQRAEAEPVQTHNAFNELTVNEDDSDDKQQIVNSLGDVATIAN